MPRPDHSARGRAPPERGFAVREALPRGAEPPRAGERADRLAGRGQRQRQGAAAPATRWAPQLLPPRGRVRSVDGVLAQDEVELNRISPDGKTLVPRIFAFR